MLDECAQMVIRCDDDDEEEELSLLVELFDYVMKFVFIFEHDEYMREHKIDEQVV